MASDDQCVLAGSDVVSFSADIPGELRQDILDCLLFAQLMADGETSSQRDWRSWHKTYTQSVNGSGARQTADIAENMLTIHRFSDLKYSPLLRGAPTDELRALFNHTLDTLMASEHAKTFFGSWFSSGRSQSFQVVPCTMTSETDVTIMLCGMQLTTMALRPALYFWQMLGGEMKVRYMASAHRFNREMFEPSRSRIQDALAHHGTRAITQL